MNRSTALELILDEKGFAFDTDRSFRGLTISESSAGWNIIVRATERRGDKVYAMSQHKDPAVGLDNLYSALAMGNGDTLWRIDRFAK